MLSLPDAIGVLRSLQAELRPDERERDEEFYQAINVVLGEVTRLRGVVQFVRDKTETKVEYHDKWEWYGNPGHFICSRWCRFHLTTKVGPWLVSTVGEYVHPRHGMGSEQKEAKWLKENWPGEEIGPRRTYETVVFRAGEPCNTEGCRCGVPQIDGAECSFAGYNDAKAATAGHMRLCREYASKPEPADKEEPTSE